MRRILGLLVLNDTSVRRRNLQLKKGKNLPQVLFQSCIRKIKKKHRKRESSTGSSFSREVSPEVTLYPVKKMKCGKTRRQTATSSDLSSSDGNDSDDLEHTSFKIVTEDEKFKLKYPKGMPSYTNKYFEEFIPEGDLKKAILTQSPVPENMDTVKKLDHFLKNLLKEKKKTNEQNIGNIFEKLQNKTRDVMGSLPKMWKILEDAKQAKGEAV